VSLLGAEDCSLLLRFADKNDPLSRWNWRRRSAITIDFGGPPGGLQSALGLLNTNRREGASTSFFLRVVAGGPPPTRCWPKQAMAAHALVAYLILALIVLHAAPALSTILSAATRC
jgi:hypothetical protein